MFGLSGCETRFTLVICSLHLIQHVFIRLLPPLIPILAVALEYPLWQLGLLISVFYVGSGLGQAPLGVFADRYDRGLLLSIGIAVAGGGYVLFVVAPMAFGGLVPDITLSGQTFTGRFVLMSMSMFVSGVGTAAVHPAGYPMITVNVADDNRGKVLGAFGSSAKVGDAVAPLGIGVLILVLSWTQIIVLFGLLGVAYGALLYSVLHTEEFQTAPRTGSKTDDTDGAMAPLDKRSYLYPLLVVYLFFITKMFTSNGINTFVPAFIVAVYAYSLEVGGITFGAESVANFYFGILLISGASSQLLIGGLTDRYDTRWILLVGVSCGTVAVLGLSVLTLSPVALLVMMLLMGVCIWGISPARDSLISEIAPAHREGRTFGYFWTGVMLVSAAMPVLVGYLIEVLGMRRGFLTLAIGTALAAVIISLLFTARVYRVDQADPHGT